MLLFSKKDKIFVTIIFLLKTMLFNLKVFRGKMCCLYIHKMSTDFPQKIPNFTCELCEIITSNKKDYAKHLLTRKHQKRTKSTDFQQKSTLFSPTYKCDHCDKDYSCRSGLWRHKKVCNVDDFHYNQIISINDTTDNVVVTTQPSDIKVLTNLVIEVVKNNQELQKQMVEMCKNVQSNINMNNCNNNSNNTFNLQVFLNEECKDAMNMSDFVNSFDIQLEDLESVGVLGYATGLSNIIVKELKLLDIYKRPIHCSDLRREVFYVKDNDVWEKESSENSKLKKAIKGITKKNMVKLNDWREEHPDCEDIDSSYNDIYMKLIIESCGGRGDLSNSENKILRNIAREVVIKK